MLKTVLITGGARGIGAAISTAFAQAGYAVAINYNTSRTCAEELVARLTSERFTACAFQADVSCQASVDSLVSRVEQTLGHVDVLVNNAGVAWHGLFSDMPAHDWERLWRVNVGGAFHCSQAVLPAMLRRQEGSIVNISSVWGLSGASCEVAYSATKAAVIGFTKALALEVAPSGIRVNCVAPGVIKTQMNDGFSQTELEHLAHSVPLGRVGLPEEVAAAVLFLASQGASYITGQTLVVDGAFSAQR